jgi:hypothetical protein
MADANFSTKDLSNDDRINQASILLYRALAINDLLYEATSDTGAHIESSTLCGVTGAIDQILRDAKEFIIHIDLRSAKDKAEVQS